MQETQTIPLPNSVTSEPSINQLQIQAQAIQAQREQYQRGLIQQRFANKLAVSATVFQALTLISASVLMIAIAKYVFTH